MSNSVFEPRMWPQETDNKGQLGHEKREQDKAKNGRTTDKKGPLALREKEELLIKRKR